MNIIGIIGKFNWIFIGKFIFDKLHETLNNMMKQQPTDETVYVKIHEIHDILFHLLDL